MPLHSDRGEHLDNIFVPVHLELIYHNRHRKSKSPKGVHEILRETFSQNGEVGKVVFLNGERGMGKTTFCKKILSSWCHVETCRRKPDAEEVLPPKEKRKLSDTAERWQKVDDTFKDIAKKYSYVFYVSLRYVKKEGNVEDMIVDQLLEGKHEAAFRYVVENETEKCLYLVDGLDEWTPDVLDYTQASFCFSGLPTRICQCTTIFTTRPWTMTNIWRQPRPTNVELKLSGLDLELSQWLRDKVCHTIDVTENTSVIYLRQPTQNGAEKDEFMNKILKTIKSGFCRSTCPMDFKFESAVHHKTGKLHHSSTEIYCDILEWNLKGCIGDREEQEIQITENQTDSAYLRYPDKLLKRNTCRKMRIFVTKLAEFCFNFLGKPITKPERGFVDVGMTSEEIDICSKFGLRYVDEPETPFTKTRELSITEIHTSFQEFLAAVYITQYPEKLQQLQQLGNSISFDIVASVLIFASGFDRTFFSKAMDILNGVNETKCPSARRKRKRFLTQETAFACLRETLPVEDDISFDLSHLYLRCSADMEMLPFLNKQCVRRLVISTTELEKYRGSLCEFVDIRALEILPVEQRDYSEYQGTAEQYDAAFIGSLVTGQNALKMVTLWDCCIYRTHLFLLLRQKTLIRAEFVDVLPIEDRACDCENMSVAEAVHEPCSSTLRKLVVVRSRRIIDHMSSAPNLQSLKLHDVSSDEYRKYMEFVSRCENVNSLVVTGVIPNMSANPNQGTDRKLSTQLRLDFGYVKTGNSESVTYKHGQSSKHGSMSSSFFPKLTPTHVDTCKLHYFEMI